MTAEEARTLSNAALQNPELYKQIQDKIEEVAKDGKRFITINSGLSVELRIKLQGQGFKIDSQSDFRNGFIVTISW